MSKKEDERNDDRDLLDPAAQVPAAIPSGLNRRKFIMRSAVISAAAVMNGCSRSETERTAPPPEAEARQVVGTSGKGAAPAVPLAPDLDVVKKEKGPVLTTLDEFYKVGPGPSSSHTIGPMRITYDFYQRAAALPADTLARATKLQVNLFGSLSATGKGHGTERAALAGLVGKEPATVDPKFLDGLRDKPDQVFPVKLGNKSIDVSLKDVIYDDTKGDFKHPNTMTVKLLGGNEVLLEQEYYSVGGGFIEWKGYTPPKKNPPKYPFGR
jgi:L-serine dehydratase